MALPIADKNGVAINLGRWTDALPGIQGGTSSQPYFSFGGGKRVHETIPQFVAVNYTGGTALATKHLTGSGNDGLTVTPTIVTGVPTTVAIVAGGTGYAANDTFSIVDATGTGAVFNVTTVSSGVVTAATYVAATATASPVDPAAVCGVVKIAVGSTTMRDITALDILRMLNHNRVYPLLGDLPILFTEDFVKWASFPQALSWDLAGQGNIVITFSIKAGWQSVSITGNYDYDTNRNVINPGTANQQPYLEPVSHRSFTLAVAAGNTVEFPNLPIDAPIRRIWLYGSVPGNITKVEMDTDSQTRVNGVIAALNSRMVINQFDMGQPSYLNQNQTAQKPLGLNPIRYFDTGLAFDLDDHYEESLKIAGSYKLIVSSAVAQNITVVLERLPGVYKQ